MRATLALAAVIAAVAAAAVVLLARGGSAPAIAPTAPVAVRAGFDEPAVEFGDAVTSRVVVTLDRDAVRPETLRVETDLTPLTALSAPVRSRTASGRLETVSITQRAACLASACLARSVAPPRLRISVASRSGGVATKTTSWQPLRLRRRVSAADLAPAKPPFAADTAPGPPTYRIAPATAATLLVVIAAVAAAAAAALLTLEARAVAHRRRGPIDGDELSRALRLVREAEGRPAPDRRRALALLARLLRGHGSLDRTASDLAWSQPEPETHAVDDLVTRVEQERAG